MKSGVGDHILIVAVALILSACAGRAPNPVPLFQPQDESMSCDAIEAELAANTAQISRLNGEENAKLAQNVAAGAAGVFFWPLWALADFQAAAAKEAVALRVRKGSLRQLSLSGGCEEIVWPAVSPPAATPLEGSGERAAR